MNLHRLLLVVALAPFAFASSPASPVATDGGSMGPSTNAAWDARAVEHLYNRAGFGARPADIEEGLRLGRAALVEKLVTQRAPVPEFKIEPVLPDDPRALRDMSKEDRQKVQRDLRIEDRRQMLEYMRWWFERMESGADPLQEKMVLFWHGLLTSSVDEVKRGWLCLQQNQLYRAHALGSYRELLEAIVEDPAMLVYLDNQVNKKGSPNENLAREIMELFSLGVGNYTEDDIKEGARALTGNGVNLLNGQFEFHARLHDDGEKTILGQKGRWKGRDFVRILLEQPACARHIAHRLLLYFEGVEPAPARLASYAADLHKSGFALQPFLTRLFNDDAFYRDEARGARVLGPVEYMVGSARRLGIEAPPVLLASGATLLGQRLFAPPSVKGWDEGESWITTASLMQRGNLAGMMLGVVKLADVFSEADLNDEPAMDGAAMGPDTMGDDPAGADDDKPAKKRGARGKDETPAKLAGPKSGNYVYAALRGFERAGWRPTVDFTGRMRAAGAKDDAQIVDRMLDELLAIHAPADTRRQMLEFVAHERGTMNVADGKLLDAGKDAEKVLRRLAHLILSLPEAQLS